MKAASMSKMLGDSDRYDALTIILYPICHRLAALRFEVKVSEDEDEGGTLDGGTTLDGNRTLDRGRTPAEDVVIVTKVR